MELDAATVSRILPHEPPIRLIESATEVEPGTSGTGHRTFAPDDTFFVGHFPERPILPGIYIIEALAQTAMVVCLCQESSEAAGSGLLARVNEMKYFEPVSPGDSIRFRIDVERRVGDFVFIVGEATNEHDSRVAEGRLTLKLG